MSAEENASLGEPLKHGNIVLELPHWKGGANPDMEPNCVTGIFVGHFVARDADAVDILGQAVARWNVALHCKATKSGVHVDWEDSVLVVYFLKCLHEVMDEWLDGIIY